jgi:hypothetical protein
MKRDYLVEANDGYPELRKIYHEKFGGGYLKRSGSKTRVAKKIGSKKSAKKVGGSKKPAKKIVHKKRVVGGVKKSGSKTLAKRATSKKPVKRASSKTLAKKAGGKKPVKRNTSKKPAKKAMKGGLSLPIKSKRVAARGAGKKAMNPYNVFVKKEMARFKKDNPAKYAKTPNTERMKMIAAAWRKMKV